MGVGVLVTVLGLCEVSVSACLRKNSSLWEHLGLSGLKKKLIPYIYTIPLYLPFCIRPIFCPSLSLFLLKKTMTRYMRSILKTLLVLFFGVSLSVPTVTGQTKFVNEFLNIGVGARAHGMSRSVVASVQDGTAAYWNPAGLHGIKAPMQFTAMHANWFGGVANYDYVGLARRMADGKAYGSVSFIRMGVDNIPNTLSLIAPDGSVDYSRVTQFSAVDYAFMGSYARGLGEQGKVSVGGTVKVIRRSIGEFGGAWGFGADLGMIYRATPKFTLALMAKDITTTFNAWSFDINEEDKKVLAATGNDIPVSSTEVDLPNFIVGAAYKTTAGKFDLLAEVDVNISTDGTESGVFSSDKLGIDPSLGIEVAYNDLVFLRGGMGNIQRAVNAANTSETSVEFQPNMGLGIKLGRLHVDYALTNIGGVSGVLASNIFSVRLDFAERKAKEDE